MHDCSEGGIAVAAAEMAFAGGLGMDMFLTDIPYKGARGKRSDYLLFSESHSRFIVEVSRQDQKKFEHCLAGVPLGLIGCTAQHSGFTVYGLDGKACVKSSIHELKEAWKKPLRW
jgi:phosphoribosylformylglycinamidine synthase